MLDGVGGSSCFSFGSNMEMLSASPDLTVRIQAGLRASALRTVHWSNAGETLNKDESERMWFQFRNSGKDLQTVMDTSIFCRTDFLCKNIILIKLAKKKCEKG